MRIRSALAFVVALGGCSELEPLLCEPCDGVCPFGLACQAGVCVAPGEPQACGLVCALDSNCAPGRVCREGQCVPEYIDFAVGNGFACVLDVAGVPRCWGENGVGQCGVAPTVDPIRELVVVEGVDDGVDIDCGSSHCCVIRADRTLACWGWNEHGQAEPGGLSGVEELVIALERTCVRFEGGRLECFGREEAAQFGSHRDRERLGVELESIVLGARHTCGVGDGRVYCWGTPFPFFGLLGAAIPVEGTAIFDTGYEDVKLVASGWNHMCALHRDGRVSCWGSSTEGQLAVPEFSAKVVDLEANADWTCARLADETVECWGYWVDRAAGLPLTPRVDGVQRVDLGFNVGCVLDRDEAIRCWGVSEAGLLGNVLQIDFPGPTIVEGVPPAVRVDLGAHHTCALDRAGDVTCWGDDSHGQLGTGAASREGGPPVQAAVEDIMDIALGAFFSCALDGEGDVWCWGGDGRSDPVTGAPRAIVEPTRVPGIPTAHRLYANYRDACVSDATGAVWCWRWPSLVPEQRSLFAGATHIAIGDAHVCAIDPVGDVVCEGNNERGQIGLSPHNAYYTNRIALPAPAVELVSGAFFSCARLSDETVSCWGDAEHGQLGDGLKHLGTGVPSVVSDLVEPRDLVGKAYSICARVAGDGVECWGSNNARQLADGTLIDRSRPEPIDGLASSIQIEVGQLHGCLVRPDGTVECWGLNVRGQIDGTQTAFLEPQPIPGL